MSSDNHRHHPVIQESIGYYSVLLPEDYDEASSADRSFPICILLHGSGGSNTSLEETANSLGRDGVIYVLPRANHPKNSAFFDKKKAGFTIWPEHTRPRSSTVNVPVDAVNRFAMERMFTKLIANCIEETKRLYRTSDDRAIVVGHSEGGAFSFLFGIHYPELTRACFASAGYYQVPTEGQDLANIVKENSILISIFHNKDDDSVDFKNATDLSDCLKKNNVPHETHFYESGGHKRRNEFIKRIREYLDNNLRE